MKKSLNVKVFEDLTNKIKSGYYSPGEKLPTENEMQSLYGVSRAPIRQALGKLQMEGLIERSPGIGTVVIENKLSTPWLPVGGFGSHFNKRWNDLTVKTLDIATVIPEEEITTKLDLEQASPMVKVTRVRMEKDVPIFLLMHYYIGVDIEKIKNAGDILNMRQFANEMLGVEYAYVTEEINAIAANEKISFYLNVEEGYPLLQIKRTSYDSDFNPVEFAQYFVKSEDWEYKITYSKDSEGVDF